MFLNDLKKTKFVIIEVLSFYLLFLVVFQVFRIAIYLYYQENFSELTLHQTSKSMLTGIRFDLSSSSIFLFFPVSFLIFPLRFTGHPIYRGIVHSLIYLILLGMIIFLTADFVYFSFVKRHVTNELLFLMNDLNYLGMEVASNWPVLTVFCVLAIFGFPVFRKWISNRNPKGKRSLFGFLLVICFMILVGRGGVQRKPIDVIDAYQYGNGNMGNLILNGIFSASHYSVSVQFIKRETEDETVYLETLGIEPTSNSDYPLERLNQTESGERKLNLVIIMVESLSLKYLDSLSGQNYGVTPNLDRLGREGLVFLNFFANGQRSVDGVQSILTGLPPLPGIPDITALSANYPRLAHLAEANHYRTLFLSSTLRESFSLDRIAGSAGFDEYYGREDYPLLLDYPEDQDRPLGWDYEVLMFLLDQLQTDTSPYLAFVNASADHTPFPKLQSPFNRFEHGPDTEGGYLNMLQYTDWAIDQFISRFREREDFRKTVFIITADHALAHFQDNDHYGKFRVPLILYAPEVFEPHVSKKYASQIDIFPSIISLLNLQGKYSAIGRNLLVDEPGFAVVKEGALINIFSPEGSLQHSLRRTVDYRPASAIANESTKTHLESKAIAFDHLTYILLTSNRWLSP